MLMVKGEHRLNLGLTDEQKISLFNHLMVTYEAEFEVYQLYRVKHPELKYNPPQSVAFTEWMELYQKVRERLDREGEVDEYNDVLKVMSRVQETDPY
jgi:hypothetical protein